MKNEKTDLVGGVFGETPKQKHPDSFFKLASVLMKNKKTDY